MNEKMTLADVVEWLTRINEHKRKMSVEDLQVKLQEAAAVLERLALEVIP